MSGELLTRGASDCRLISLGRIDERRGSLCVAEIDRHVPFEIQRAYWIFDVPSAGVRGDHAHRSQSELLVALQGSITVRCDDGVAQTAYTLDAPDCGLLLAPMVFHDVTEFSAGSICLVLASGRYDPDEYINDYTEFRELIAQR